MRHQFSIQVHEKPPEIDNFEATLELYFAATEGAGTTLSPEELAKKRKADKLLKKQEKLAKKAAREERIRVYNENVARREKISKEKKLKKSK